MKTFHSLKDELLQDPAVKAHYDALASQSDAMKKQEIVASAYVHRDGLIMLAKRAATKRFLPGVFEVPGGHVEYGESVAQAVERELREELAVSVQVGEPFYSFTYMDGETHVVEICVLCSLDPGREVRLMPEEYSEVRWMGEAEALAVREAGDPFLGALAAAYERLKD